MSESAIPEDILNRVKILQEEIDQLQLNMSTIEQQIAILSNATHSISDAIRTQNELKTKTCSLVCSDHFWVYPYCPNR